MSPMFCSRLPQLPSTLEGVCPLFGSLTVHHTAHHQSCFCETSDTLVMLQHVHSLAYDTLNMNEGICLLLPDIFGDI